MHEHMQTTYKCLAHSKGFLSVNHYGYRPPLRTWTCNLIDPRGVRLGHLVLVTPAPKPTYSSYWGPKHHIGVSNSVCSMYPGRWDPILRALLLSWCFIVPSDVNCRMLIPPGMGQSSHLRSGMCCFYTSPRVKPHWLFSDLDGHYDHCEPCPPPQIPVFKSQ